jgi:hypothetical protein
VPEEVVPEVVTVVCAAAPAPIAIRAVKSTAALVPIRIILTAFSLPISEL